MSSRPSLHLFFLFFPLFSSLTCYFFTICTPFSVPARAAAFQHRLLFIHAHILGYWKRDTKDTTMQRETLETVGILIKSNNLRQTLWNTNLIKKNQRKEKTEIKEERERGKQTSSRHSLLCIQRRGGKEKTVLTA